MEIEPDVAFDYDQLGAVCTDLAHSDRDRQSPFPVPAPAALCRVDRRSARRQSRLASPWFESPRSTSFARPALGFQVYLSLLFSSSSASCANESPKFKHPKNASAPVCTGCIDRDCAMLQNG